MFFRLLADIVNVSNQTKYLFLCDQPCMIKPTLINLHRNEYSQKLHYYLLEVNLGRCTGSCNTLDDLIK